VFALILDIMYYLDISDDGRAANNNNTICIAPMKSEDTEVQRDTSQEYQPFRPPVSEQELCERVRQRVPDFQRLPTRDIWRGTTYSTYHSTYIRR